jgi:hypothetical protein
MSTPSSEPQASADLPSRQVAPGTTNPSTSPMQGGPERGPENDAPANDIAKPSSLQRLRDWLDRLLVADVFLVLAGALWFAGAVLLHSQGVEAPLALFQRLWEPLFTPAIGLLMAAALLSGALGWWQRRGQR